MTVFNNSTNYCLWDEILGSQTPESVKSTVRTLKVGIWNWNISEKSLMANEYYHTMIGEEPVDTTLPYQFFLDRLHPQDLETVLRAHYEVDESPERNFEAVFRLKCSNGAYQWIRSAGVVAERDSHGKAQRIIGHHHSIDCAKRNQIAQQAANSYTKLGSQQEALIQYCKAVSSIFDSCYVGIDRIIDKDGVAWASNIGGWNNGVPVLSAEYQVAGTACEKTIQNGQYIGKPEVSTPFSDSTLPKPFTPASYAGICLNDQLGKPSAILSIASDAPLNPEIDVQCILKLVGTRVELELQRREIDAELRYARHIAEQASRSKTEFFDTMSHSIRNPMTSIIGYTELLSCDKELRSDPVQSMEAIHAIKKSSNHLLSIVNEILDASNIESGNLVIESVPVNPIQVVENVFAELQENAVAQNTAFNIEYIGDLPEKVVTDPNRFKQVLTNLVENAINCTKQGTVTIAVSCKAVDELEGTMKFEVIDTGVGMTTDQIMYIESFQQFSMTNGTASVNNSGVGLRLQMSNTLATMLGGGIDIDSEPGKGSTFSLTIATGFLGNVKMLNKNDIAILNERPESVQAPQDANKQPLAGKRFLVAEDSPESQKLIAYHLKKAGAEVVVADNGLIALEKTKLANDQGKTFHVIFMDMQMPVLDGYEATEQLRDQGHEKPIIALTANALDGDRLKCIMAGCDDYASKPINAKHLIKMSLEYSDDSAQTGNGGLV